MYHSKTTLKPLLEPNDYCSPEVFARERQALFAESWHPVGVASSVQKPGEYLSADVMGVPILVRNFDGDLVALRNVCAHRQCSLVSAAHGSSDRLKCPFHGWEYGADGRNRKIPGVSNFPQFDREEYRLDSFPLEQCGDMVFVRLSENGPSLREWLGKYYKSFSEWFSLPDFRIVNGKNVDYPANWKIPIEISLESYHIPEVHPMTFGEDPGEPRSEHFFTEAGSSFNAKLATPRFIDKALRVWEKGLLGFLGIKSQGAYRHYHVYPNLLVSYTDSLSLVHFIMPVSPTSSVACIWHFCRQPARKGWLRQRIAAAWGRFTAGLTLAVLKEDLAMYPTIQAGVEGASKSGLLGRCEERLHSFQEFVQQKMSQASEFTTPASASENSAACTTECPSGQVSIDD